MTFTAGYVQDFLALDIADGFQERVRLDPCAPRLGLGLLILLGDLALVVVDDDAVLAFLPWFLL